MDDIFGGSLALVAAVAWIFIPGWIGLRLIGAPTLTAVTAAPVASVAWLSVLPIILGGVGIPWNPISVIIATALVLTLGFGARVIVVRRRTGEFDPASASTASGRFSRGALIAWGAAALIIAVQLAAGIGRLDAVSQTFDNGFHLNVVRFILDGGNASSFAVTGVLGVESFYPAAWHDVVSLVAMTPAVELSVAVIMTNAVVAAIVWPAGVLLLVTVIFPNDGRALAIAAVIAALTPWFPLLLLTYGVLYPFFLATALLPVAIAAAFSVLGGRASIARSRWVRIAVSVLAVIAIGLAQPAVVIAGVAFVVPLFVGWVVRFVRAEHSRRAKAGVLAAAIVVLLSVAAVWVLASRVGAYAPWGPSTGWRAGVAEALLLFRGDDVPSWALALSALIGIVWMLVKRRHLWLAGAWLIAVVLFYAAEVIGSPAVRTLLLGAFYKDPPRLAALLAVMSVPVAVVGAVAVWRAIARLLGDRTATPDRLREALIGAGIILVLALGQAPAMMLAVSGARAAHSLEPSAPILSEDELELLKRLPETTEPDAVIAGNPWTGTNLAYAIAGRSVLNPHFNIAGTADQLLINAEIVDVARNPDVCAALERTGVGYVLDFGDNFRDAAGLLDFDATAGFPGFVGLDSAAGFEAIDREGDAVLYRITACER